MLRIHTDHLPQQKLKYDKDLKLLKFKVLIGKQQKSGLNPISVIY